MNYAFPLYLLSHPPQTREDMGGKRKALREDMVSLLSRPFPVPSDWWFV